MKKVVFVCWGNICRSPMAERVAERYLREHGIEAHLTSAATSREEIGAPIDPRAVQSLTGAGYRTDGHAAHQITAEEIAQADLVVAMEQIHVDKMRRMTGADNANVVLLTDYDPESEPGAGVPDPWYGDQDGFQSTLATIERAMPGLAEAIRRL